MTDQIKKDSGVYKIFRERRSKQTIANNPIKVEKAHAKGKLTAQERMAALFDNGKYEETDPWIRNRCVQFDLYKKDVENEGVITGFGQIFERKVCAFSHDVFVMGASLGEAQGIKICRTIELAMKAGIPIVGLNDASGARIQEGVAGLHGYCSVFGQTSIASGWVPQISIILGTCAGGAAYSSALTDFLIMVNPIGKMFITGPAVIKSVTGEDVTFDQLGGSQVHGSVTGLVHFVVDSESEAMDLARILLTFLPSNSKELPPVYQNSDPITRRAPEIVDIIPENQNKGFDMKEIIRSVVDHGDFLEIQEKFAMNMIIGFARIDGRTVGIVGNRPKVLAGCIDNNAAWKAARFVRFCDSFNIPLITFADCPGYLPGLSQEYNGIIRNGSKMLFAYSEATVPKITVVVRKDYGGAYSAMCGKGVGADVVLAFPTAEIAVMGAEGAANIVFKHEIEKAEDKQEKRIEMIEKYRDEFLNPYRAAEYGIVDDIIEPSELREKLAMHLDILKDKNIWSPYKKHSNIPL
ncbi:MAG: methylmalonyl-CoA carboxyltransferase [Firmicutes bacterium HGW-Firmicutes-12]|nr:MAG: methylmalonyl-CoA carboxyltransferase [Firmicutes bacterium HGW-Firmicutes-12]